LLLLLTYPLKKKEGGELAKRRGEGKKNKGGRKKKRKDFLVETDASGFNAYDFPGVDAEGGVNAGGGKKKKEVGRKQGRESLWALWVSSISFSYTKKVLRRKKEKRKMKKKKKKEREVFPDH